MSTQLYLTLTKKAISYSLNQREYLCTFLEHGEIEISNNQVENAIRPIVVGRKNWLFCDTQGGAVASTIIFTVLETAKANDLNPETYLNHILTVLPERFSQNAELPFDDLFPWAEDICRFLSGRSSLKIQLWFQLWSTGLLIDPMCSI